MASVDASSVPEVPKARFKPIIETTPAKVKQLAGATFDPKTHLAYEAPQSVVTMKDIGLDDVGVSPVAVSQPFRLFSNDAVQKFRDEALNPEVMNSCMYKSNLAAYQLRGYVSKNAPFTYDAWNHPETLSSISKIAGVDLVPVMNFEISHVNISVKSEKETKEELTNIERECEYCAEDEGIGGCPWEDDKPVVGWHTDSYPFVCVTMLSDCTNMVGGETALRTGSGGVIKVRGPGMGCAVVLQGRYIEHQALPALGSQERITMVTSFRPKSPQLPDDSVLRTIRGVSDLSELYYEYGQYRLEILEERVRAQLKCLRVARAVGRKTDTEALKRFLNETTTFLQRTNAEIVQEEDVITGYQPILDIRDEKPPTPLVEEEQSPKKVKHA